MLSQHALIRYNMTFKIFLTCESAEEFEEFKNNSGYAYGESSIMMNSLKKFNIQDSFNYLYSAIKTKYFDTTEPEEIKTSLELDEINGKISKYLPVIEKYIELLNCEIKFYKEHVARQDDLSSALEDVIESDGDFEKCLNDAAEYYMKASLVNRTCVKYSEQVLAEIKRERLSLEGIKSAITSRKESIEQYNTMSRYAKAKMDKCLESASGAVKEEKEKLADGIEKVKERILKINNNLDMELKNYSKNRAEGLRKILGSACNASYEVGKKVMQFAKGRQKDFPMVKLTTEEDEHLEDEVGDFKGGKVEDKIIEYID
eukprot:TRINITY_DN5968_c0_g1_i5.p1 TRINITY_DN5968_c0_g1~~TRINITY_DN5968_c0_g1_i5.p1  ORF type:complete len:316 (-),score=98.12 TRINITY_DN5968_c0_g1_i5:154-1101(-)